MLQFNVIRLFRLNLSGGYLLRSGLQMNRDVKGYLRNISAITLALVQSSKISKEGRLLYHCSSSLSLSLCSAQTLFFCFIKCVCVFMCVSSGGQTWEDVCGSKQDYVCFRPCLLHNWAWAAAAVWRPDADRASQTVLQRARPIQPPRQVQYGSVNSCLHICLSLSAAVVFLSLQKQ